MVLERPEVLAATQAFSLSRQHGAAVAGTGPSLGRSQQPGCGGECWSVSAAGCSRPVPRQPFQPVEGLCILWESQRGKAPAMPAVGSLIRPHAWAADAVPAAEAPRRTFVAPCVPALVGPGAGSAALTEVGTGRIGWHLRYAVTWRVGGVYLGGTPLEGLPVDGDLPDREHSSGTTMSSIGTYTSTLVP